MCHVSPSLQGDLDGLCGAYSLVNAISWMMLNKINKRKLFRSILEEYSNRWDLVDWIMDGIDSSRMAYVIKRTILSEPYKNKYPIILERPFTKGSDVRIDGVFNSIDSFLQRHELHSRAVLMANQEHWSVVIRSSPKSIFFFDSSSATLANKKFYGLEGDGQKYTLCLDSIYFLYKDHEFFKG